jgi:hypothetical protein
MVARRYPAGVPAKVSAAQRALPQLAAPVCRPTSSLVLPQQRIISCQASSSDSDSSVLEQAASAVTPTNGTTSVLATAAEVSSGPPSTPEPENNNGNKDDKDAPKHRSWMPDASSLAPLQFEPLSDSERGWANFKLLFALPWRRFKKDAVLSFKLEGEISDQLQVGLPAAADWLLFGVGNGLCKDLVTTHAWSTSKCTALSFDLLITTWSAAACAGLVTASCIGNV